jgi:lysophospholipase L1-like esterase
MRMRDWTMRARTIGATAAFMLLAACAGAPPPAVTPPPEAPRFDAAIAAFETADREAAPPRCATLFVGSSSIRFWETLKADFPDRTVINRGFGGSTIWEVNHYFDRVVAPYRPKEIVFYAGENDLAAGRTPAEAYADFAAFMAKKDAALGKTPVWYISAKPSKLRWDQRDAFQDLNGRIKALAGKRADLAFIDVWPAMLGPDGQPKDIYVEDRLHMNPAGYALWTPLVDAALDQGQKAKAPGC